MGDFKLGAFVFSVQLAFWHGHAKMQFSLQENGAKANFKITSSIMFRFLLFF